MLAGIKELARHEVFVLDNEDQSRGPNHDTMFEGTGNRKVVIYGFAIVLLEGLIGKSPCKLGKWTCHLRALMIYS